MPDGLCFSKIGGRMTTRRQWLFGLGILLAAGLGAAGPAKAEPLQVTYYYLPG
jgi:hypothetical protein